MANPLETLAKKAEEQLAKEPSASDLAKEGGGDSEVIIHN